MSTVFCDLMDKLGIRIKERREVFGCSLNELSNSAGVSSSLLSQIEHGKASPSLHTLKKIADSLHTTVGLLIGENESIANNPVVRFNDKKFIKQTENGATLYMLSNYSPLQNMETYYIRLERNGDCKGITEGSRYSQEFCHVISGSIEVTINRKPNLLNQSDSVYFDSKELESIKNVSEGVTDFIWVVSTIVQ